VLKLHKKISKECLEKESTTSQTDCAELLSNFITDKASYCEIVDVDEQRNEEIRLVRIQEDLGRTGILQAITDFSRMRGQEGLLIAGSLTAAVILSHLRDNTNQALADVLREMIAVSNTTLSTQGTL
jgi:hypothetical protein